MEEPRLTKIRALLGSTPTGGILRLSPTTTPDQWELIHTGLQTTQIVAAVEAQAWFRNGDLAAGITRLHAAGFTTQWWNGEGTSA